jgi:hypothetical protein
VSRNTPRQEIEPIRNLRERIIQDEVIVVHPGYGREHREQRPPARWEPSRECRWRAAKHGGEMTRVAEQPSTLNANLVIE